MAPKDQHLALSSGVGLAGFTVTNFWDYGWEAIENFKDEIIESAIKPSKVTAIHHYLSFFQDIYEEIDSMSKNGDDMEQVYNFIVRTLDEVNLSPDLPEPNFDKCNGPHEHFECECTEKIEKWIEYVDDNSTMINDLIVHSAFQFIFQDRKFLHDFHLELSQLIEDEMDYCKLSL